MHRLALVACLLLLALATACASDDYPLVDRALCHGGLDRTLHLHLPRNRDRSKPAPLVICLHGGGGTSEGMPKLTKHGFDSRGDRDGWVVAYPDGVSRNWNDGRTVEGSEAHTKKIDDVGFIAALIDDLVAHENVDPRRVYVTGMSNGGFMAHRLGRELASKIAAIAPVAANLPLESDLATIPSRAVSVLAINGTEDPLVPFEGGSVHFLRRERGRCRSARETIDWWAKTDGCGEATKSDEPDRDPKDGTRVQREVHAGGRDGTEVILYTVENGGHTWPMGLRYAPELLIGKTSRDLDADEAIWEFFRRHRLPD